MTEDQQERTDEPTVAPSQDRTRTLEDEPSDKDKARGNVTEVTHLYLDRTPDD